MVVGSVACWRFVPHDLVTLLIIRKFQTLI